MRPHSWLFSSVSEVSAVRNPRVNGSVPFIAELLTSKLRNAVNADTVLGMAPAKKSFEPKTSDLHNEDTPKRDGRAQPRHDGDHTQSAHSLVRPSRLRDVQVTYVNAVSAEMDDGSTPTKSLFHSEIPLQCSARHTIAA